MSPRAHRALWGAAAASLASVLAPAAWGDDATCINAIEQGLTLRQRGQLHDALKVLAACSDPACPTELRAECAQRIDAIGLAIPTIVFAAKDGAGNDLYDVKVTMDGAPLVASLDGRPVSVDPGEHDFVFETAGQPPVEKKLVLREGEKNRSESVVLGPLPPPPPAAPASTPAPAVAPVPAASTRAWSTAQTLAIVSGAVGVVGLGLGAMWGGYAISAKNMQNACSSSVFCSRNQALEDYNTAQRNATGSTIALSVGAALVAGGVVLWITAPTHRPSAAPVAGFWLAPAAAPSGGELTIGGDL
jgi:hypothetical protein